MLLNFNLHAICSIGPQMNKSIRKLDIYKERLTEELGYISNMLIAYMMLIDERDCSTVTDIVRKVMIERIGLPANGKVWCEQDVKLYAALCKETTPTREEFISVQSGQCLEDDRKTDRVCPICLECIRRSESTLSLLCGHSFHVDCIASNRDERCPECRRTTADCIALSEQNEY